MGPIAVFDSGVGGLSVLRELVAQMPSEHFLYFGDSANAPYGTRPTAEIRSLTLAHAERLFDQGAKALVVACNTATSAAIGALRTNQTEAVVLTESLGVNVGQLGGLADGEDGQFDVEADVIGSVEIGPAHHERGCAHRV